MNLVVQKIINEREIIVNHLDMQERIVDDVKDMDMDSLKALIEFMYPVKVEDEKGAEGLELKITLKENSELDSLDQVF